MALGGALLLRAALVAMAQSSKLPWLASCGKAAQSLRGLAFLS